MTESGKWIASSSSVRSARRSRPGATAASDIAAIRPGIEREARYSRTTVAGSPSPASAAIIGTNARYSSRPMRPSALQSSRAYVSDPPTTPGTSVSSEIPTTSRVKQAS